MKKLVETSLKKVEKWVEEQNYAGYEPFDGLTSWIKPLTCGSLLGERLLQQLIRQSPVNLRPLLGVRPLESTKGRGYMAWGYLKMALATGSDVYAEKARRCLNWLKENKAPGYENYCWGNHFDFASRVGRIRRYEPIMPWSSLIGQAFLDAYEVFTDRDYLDIAVSVCDWILKVPRKKTESGTCLGYTALGESTVHGASMLGAALLARTANYTGNEEALEVAREAMEYSCSRQNADGSWYYSEDANCRWIDNFHTGYNLDSLKCYIENTNDESYKSILKRGFDYYVNHFFEDNGRPNYYHNRAFPVDIQCAAQSIDTLAYFSEYYDALGLAKRVALWTISNMQDVDGYFYYRQWPHITIKIPMLHWGQATMYKSLAYLLTKI